MLLFFDKGSPCWKAWPLLLRSRVRRSPSHSCRLKQPTCRSRWPKLRLLRHPRQAACRLQRRRKTRRLCLQKSSSWRLHRIDQEVEEGLRCATCHREVDVENTVVVNRQTGKRKEVRRCKSCHSLRAAVQRLQKNHGALVQDFTQAPGSKVEAFYRDHGDLRGEDLRVALQQVVTDWKQARQS